MLAHFPVVVTGSDAEGFCAKVSGTPVLGEGDTVADALVNASEILAEVIDDAVASGEAIPRPGEPVLHAEEQNQVAVIQAVLPAVPA